MENYIIFGLFVVCFIAFLFAYDRLVERHRYRVAKRMVQGRHYSSPMFMAQKRFSFIWYPIGSWQRFPADAWRDVNDYIERKNDPDENFYDPQSHVDPSLSRPEPPKPAPKSK